METIYLSLMAQVAVGTIFMKSTVCPQKTKRGGQTHRQTHMYFINSAKVARLLVLLSGFRLSLAIDRWINTVGVMKTVSSVYTLIINTIYLSSIPQYTGSWGNRFQETHDRIRYCLLITISYYRYTYYILFFLSLRNSWDNTLEGRAPW